MSVSERAVGVDVGGTFTDVVSWDGGALSIGKVPSTKNQSDGVAAAVEGIASGLLLHGTTVATNALLEGKGARTVLITTPGFEDAIEIGRQERPSLYDANSDRAPTLVERSGRHGFVSDQALHGFLEETNPESVAIALLDAFADNSAEETIAQSVATWKSSVPVSQSSMVSPEFREYERTATTVLNAYLRPVVGEYLEALEDVLGRPMLVMRSSGGLTSLRRAAELAASILLSGPAGGVVAAAACGAAQGWERVISFDMGGTSTDVCRIEKGVPQIGVQRSIGGYLCRLPSVDVHTIGAGGGSIGWIDPGGALRVGPHSAGAWPGPASYGRGGAEATVTDANLLLGRLGHTLAGGTVLDLEASRRALASLGTHIGLSADDTARGMIEIVNSHMEGALRRVSVEEGADPRQAALIAFGGAGGLHASAIARSLGMSAVLIPPHAGVFSALGLLLSPLRHDVSQSVIGVDLADLDEKITALEKRARTEMRQELGVEATRVDVIVDCRYHGQSHETPVPYVRGSGRLRSDFESAHLARNGFVTAGVEVEVVNVRVAAIAPSVLAWSDVAPTLVPGTEYAGPMTIESLDATTYLGDGERGVVLDDGTLLVTW